MTPEGRDTYVPGTRCTVNFKGDISMTADARRFLGAPCHVIKRTKSGLILVALSGTKHTHAFPQRNIDLQ